MFYVIFMSLSIFMGVCYFYYKCRIFLYVFLLRKILFKIFVFLFFIFLNTYVFCLFFIKIYFWLEEKRQRNIIFNDFIWQAFKWFNYGNFWLRIQRKLLYITRYVKFIKFFVLNLLFLWKIIIFKNFLYLFKLFSLKIVNF